jgi:hypothetical protein
MTKSKSVGFIDGSDKERSRDGVSEVNVQQFKEEV